METISLLERIKLLFFLLPYSSVTQKYIFLFVMLRSFSVINAVQFSDRNWPYWLESLYNTDKRKITDICKYEGSSLYYELARALGVPYMYVYTKQYTLDKISCKITIFVDVIKNDFFVIIHSNLMIL